MEWYYSENNQQRGPVDDAQFAVFVQQGIIRPETLVWNAGMSDWKTYADVMTSSGTGAGTLGSPAGGGGVFGGGFEPYGAAASVCSQCGRAFPPAEMIQYGSQMICAECKPGFFQRISEGGVLQGELHYAGFWIRALALIIDSLLLGFVAGALAATYALTVGRGIFEAFQLWSGNPEDFAPILPYLGGMLPFIFIYLVVYVWFYVYFVGKRGATPGKQALKLQIVRGDGSPMTYMRAFGRMCAYMLNGLVGAIASQIVGLIPLLGPLLSIPVSYFPYIMAGVDTEKRALHDRICDTRVIRT